MFNLPLSWLDLESGHPLNGQNDFWRARFLFETNWWRLTPGKSVTEELHKVCMQSEENI